MPRRVRGLRPVDQSMEILRFYRERGKRHGKEGHGTGKVRGTGKLHYSHTTAASQRESARPSVAIVGRLSIAPEAAAFPRHKDSKVFGEKTRTTIVMTSRMTRTTTSRTNGTKATSPTGATGGAGTATAAATTAGRRQQGTSATQLAPTGSHWHSRRVPHAPLLAAVSRQFPLLRSVPEAPQLRPWLLRLHRPRGTHYLASLILPVHN